MQRKIIISVLCILMLFPVAVIWSAGREKVTSRDMEAAREYVLGLTERKTPCTRPDGRPFTIAFIDIDPYPASGEMLYYLIERLRESGWLEYGGDLPFDPENTDCRLLISWLAGQNTGKYVRFLDSQNYYLLIDGEEACKKRLQAAIDKKEVDLILCLGTSPGTFAKGLRNDTIPVMVYFSVDPVGAGISDEEEYSGQTNIWCHVNYSVYTKQIRFYFDNVHFRNIGMVYYDENVAAMRAYREAALEDGFHITEKKIRTLAGNSREQTETYYRNLKKVFREMADSGIDAFMLSTDIIKDESRIRELIAVFNERKIPVFVQNGEYFVKNGALMVVTASDAKEQAPFAADVFGEILNGKEPGSINQVFLTPPYLTINLGTADKTGFQVKEELILSAEKIYQE